MMRRSLLAAALLSAVGSARAQQRQRVEVWRDPSCGCCEGWVQHLRTEGFVVTDRVVPSVGPYRQLLGTPPDLLSCHAARVSGLALEGHVPAHAIRRLLEERPAGIVGLAVPGMPIGTPGMEVSGQEPDIYDVIAWRQDGTSRPWLRMRGAGPV